MHVQCPHCDEPAAITPESTLVMYFKKQPWFSFILITCTECDEQSRLFFGPKWVNEVPIMREAGIGFMEDEFAPDELVQSYITLYEIEVPQEHPLTKREEGEVERLHAVLETIPLDLLWSIFTEEGK